MNSVNRTYESHRPVILGALVIGIALGIWSISIPLGWSGSTIRSFGVAAGLFIVLSCIFVGIYGFRNNQWGSLPVLVTARALLEFIIVPCWLFATGGDSVESGQVEAVWLTLAGFVALWIGSLICKKGGGFHFAPRTYGTSNRVAYRSLGMLVLGVGGNAVLWKMGMLSYTGEGGSQNLVALSQWVAFIASLLNWALLITAIEVLGKQSARMLVRATFWAALVCSVGIGMVSGMKEAVLTPFVEIILIYGIARNRIPKSAVMLPLMLVSIYPFINAYRSVLNNGGREQAHTVSGLSGVMMTAVDDVMEAPLSGTEEFHNGVDSTKIRLSLLADVRDVIELPAPSLLNGDEKVWLAPVYPLIPRFVWKSKPVLDKGGRFSVALGRPASTSSAVTPIGDLYSLYGVNGVIAGMLLYGVGLQIYTNKMCKTHMSEIGLFIYMAVLLPLLDIEKDVVGLISEAVHVLILVLVVSLVVYGRRGFRSAATIPDSV